MSDDVGPAFPFADVYGPGGEGIREGSSGMTLRDWLAGQAMQGILASDALVRGIESGAPMRRAIAEAAYALADAMLAARRERSSS